MLNRFRLEVHVQASIEEVDSLDPLVELEDAIQHLVEDHRKNTGLRVVKVRTRIVKEK